MAQVIVMNNNIEPAIRLFKRMVDREGFLTVVRRRLEDDPKPSARRRKKARIAERRKKAAMKRWLYRRGQRDG